MSVITYPFLHSCLSFPAASLPYPFFFGSSFLVPSQIFPFTIPVDNEQMRDVLLCVLDHLLGERALQPVVRIPRHLLLHEFLQLHEFAISKFTDYIVNFLSFFVFSSHYFYLFFGTYESIVLRETGMGMGPWSCVQYAAKAICISYTFSKRTLYSLNNAAESFLIRK